VATIKRTKSNRHKRDSALYFLKKKNGRPHLFRTNKAKEYTIKRIMEGREYITISAHTLSEIIDTYEFEKIRLRKMKELEEELFG